MRGACTYTLTQYHNESASHVSEVDVFLPNEDEAMGISKQSSVREAAHFLAGIVRMCCVVTCGKDGVVMQSRYLHCSPNISTLPSKLFYYLCRHSPPCPTPCFPQPSPLPPLNSQALYDHPPHSLSSEAFLALHHTSQDIPTAIAHSVAKTPALALSFLSQGRLLQRF